jgi:hypothetical protein
MEHVLQLFSSAVGLGPCCEATRSFNVALQTSDSVHRTHRTMLAVEGLKVFRMPPDPRIMYSAKLMSTFFFVFHLPLLSEDDDH